MLWYSVASQQMAVGAKHLKSIVYSSFRQEAITKACNTKRVWNFIPPGTPHFGRLWEAAVKSAKHLLLKTVAIALLTYEELETVMEEIVAILNP